jgi:predicted DNA binding CopG/RHH family protein
MKAACSHRAGRRGENPRFNYEIKRYRDVSESQQIAPKPLIFQRKREFDRRRIALEVENMSEERKQTYTIRIPEEISTRIEEAARTRGIPPTTLLQSLVLHRFKSQQSVDFRAEELATQTIVAKLDSLRKILELQVRSGDARIEQLRFEIVKTRAALFHSLDQSLGATVVDQIIEASEQTAREYTAGIARGEKW